MRKIIFTIFSGLLVLSACNHQKSSHTKIQPSEVVKSTDPKKTATIILTPDAKNRLAIKSQAFPKGADGKQMVPISALLYDNDGSSWFFVEESPLKFHREKIRVLKTENDQISVESNFDPALPVVIQGAAELN